VQKTFKLSTQKRKALEASLSSTDDGMASSGELPLNKPPVPPKPLKPNVTKKQKPNEANGGIPMDDDDSFFSTDDEQHMRHFSPTPTYSQDDVRKIVGVDNAEQQSQQQSKKTNGTAPEKNVHKRNRKNEAKSTESGEYDKFSKTDKAPYKILIETKDVTDETPAISVHRVGRMIQHAMKIHPSSINDMRKTGKHRVRVVTDNRMIANQILYNCAKIFPSFKCHIPSEDKYNFGIIRNIPLDFDLEEVKEEIDPKYNVVSIERLTTPRTNKDGVKEYLPTTTLKVKFMLNFLPDTIQLFMVRTKITPYVWRARPCSKCQRYGHSFKSCKANTRCANCGENHPEQSCQVPTKCMYCGLSHKVGDSQCPEQMKQTELKSIMTIEKKPYRQALFELHNKYESLVDVEDFPSISESQGRKPNFPLGRKWRETVFSTKIKRDKALAAYLKNSKKLITGEVIQSDPLQPLSHNPHKTTELEKIKSSLTEIINTITQNFSNDKNNDNILINVANALTNIMNEPTTNWSTIASQGPNSTPNTPLVQK
jgi:hypothetical protein